MNNITIETKRCEVPQDIGKNEENKKLSMRIAKQIISSGSFPSINKKWFNRTFSRLLDIADHEKKEIQGFISPGDKQDFLHLLEHTDMDKVFSEVMGRYYIVFQQYMRAGEIVKDTVDTWPFIDDEDNYCLQKFISRVEELPDGSENKLFPDLEYLEQAGTDLQCVRSYCMRYISGDQALSEFMKEGLKDMEAKDDMHYLCDQEGYTYIYDPEMLSCAAVRSSLGGLTQKQLDGIINVGIANKADIKEYLGEKINLHNGRGVVYPFLQKGCDGDDVTQRENPFAKRYVLDLRIEGLDIATHEENNMIEEYVAKICETSYHTGGQNENTKTAMSMLLGRYGTGMDAYKTKLGLETVGNRSFTKVVERGKDFGSARFDHDSPEALFIVLKRIHTETIDE